VPGARLIEADYIWAVPGQRAPVWPCHFYGPGIRRLARLIRLLVGTRTVKLAIGRGWLWMHEKGHWAVFKIGHSGEAKGPASAGPVVDLLLLLALGMRLISVLIGGL
jgi:hypothetical protein